jgi:hypothetical protein
VVIIAFDGKMRQGGLADRLRSVVVAYDWCREHGVRFAIDFSAPFRLEDYLQPADYDWRLAPGERSMNSADSVPVFIDAMSLNQPEREHRWQQRELNRLLSRNHRQIHLYAQSLSYLDDSPRFGTLFRELFRPVPRIEQMLQHHRSLIGGPYVAVTTRFMELLGDFVEPHRQQPTSEAERRQLIDACIGQLEQLHQLNPVCRVLVTSDSARFISEASRLPYVYTIEGEITHVDAGQTVDHTKTFVDFLMIAGADKVYQLRTGRMYGGCFSRCAASSGHAEFHRIEF